MRSKFIQYLHPVFFVMLCTAAPCLVVQAQTVVDPSTFPAETNPQNSNFEFYSRKGGTNKRATFDDVRKRMGALVRQPEDAGYTPDSTGNAFDNGYFLRDGEDVWYVDGLGNGLMLNRNSELDTRVDTAYVSADTLRLLVRTVGTGALVKTIKAPVPGTNLTYSGAASPITLQSSTGADVIFKDSTGVNIRQVGSTMTILNTGALGSGLANRLGVWQSNGYIGYGGQFFADTVNDRIGIGVIPTVPLHVSGQAIITGATAISNNTTGIDVLSLSGTPNSLTLRLQNTGSGGSNWAIFVPNTAGAGTNQPAGGLVVRNTASGQNIASFLPAGGVYFYGPGTTTSTYGLIVTNSGGATATASLAVRDDGAVIVGSNTNTTSNAFLSVKTRSTTASNDYVFTTETLGGTLGFGILNNGAVRVGSSLVSPILSVSFGGITSNVTQVATKTASDILVIGGGNINKMFIGRSGATTAIRVNNLSASIGFDGDLDGITSPGQARLSLNGDLYMGPPTASSNPSANVYRIMSTRSISGTTYKGAKLIVSSGWGGGNNATGQDLILQAGFGTGTGLSGKVIIETTTPSASGSTQNTTTETAFVFAANKMLGINIVTPTSNVDIDGANGYTQLRLRQTFTPTATADANGAQGDFAWDDDYIYIKTSAGWKRTALSTF